METKDHVYLSSVALSVLIFLMSLTFAKEVIIIKKEIKGFKHVEIFKDKYEFDSIEVLITAYTSSKSECGKWNDGFTKAMIRVDDLKWSPLGIVAVDPKVIPLGSLVYIPGVGLHLACDTGNKIKGNKVDRLMNSKEEAFEWGKKESIVLIIKEKK